MIQINPLYEKIFDVCNIDQDCDKIAALMGIEGNMIEEALKAGLHKQAVTMYLQLLKSMCNHFIKDEHWCYFDDMYSPEYTMQRLYETIMKCNLEVEVKTLLDTGHEEIIESECCEDYGYPSYID